MRTVGQLLEQKGHDVVTIEPDATVLDAARRMDERRIGALVVIEHDRVAGIFSERDLMRRVVVMEKEPSKTLVREVMTDRVLFCEPSCSLDEVRALMRTRRIRHVPIVENDRLVGIVSIGDVNVVEQRIQEETIQYLEQYMYKP